MAPNEVSINCVNDGIKTVYGKGFEKPPFYSVFVNYGFVGFVPWYCHAADRSYAQSVEYVLLLTLP